MTHLSILGRVLAGPSLHGNYLDEIFFAAMLLITLAVVGYLMLLDVKQKPEKKARRGKKE